MIKDTIITKAITNIISVVDSTNLSFDKKRSTIIKKVTEYYTKGEILTEDIIERKNSIDTSKLMLHNYFIPFLVGAFSSLLSMWVIESFETIKNASFNFKIVLNVFIVIVSFGLMQFFYKLIKLFFTTKSPYEKFDIKDSEIKIINSLRDERTD